MEEKKVIIIEELVDRWLEGETSLDEERALAEYFDSGNVAEEFEWAVPLFAHYASVRATTPSTAVAPSVSAAPTSRLRTLRIALATTISVAAAMTIGLFGVSQAQKQTCAYINGVAVCDVSVVMESAAPVFARLNHSLQPLNKTRESLSKVKSSTNRATAIIEKYNIEKLLQQ